MGNRDCIDGCGRETKVPGKRCRACYMRSMNMHGKYGMTGSCQNCDVPISSISRTLLCRRCYTRIYKTQGVDNQDWKPAPARKIYHVPDYKTDTVKRVDGGVFP